MPYKYSLCIRYVSTYFMSKASWIISKFWSEFFRLIFHKNFRRNCLHFSFTYIYEEIAGINLNFVLRFQIEDALWVQNFIFWSQVLLPGLPLLLRFAPLNLSCHTLLLLDPWKVRLPRGSLIPCCCSGVTALHLKALLHGSNYPLQHAHASQMLPIVLYVPSSKRLSPGTSPCPGSLSHLLNLSPRHPVPQISVSLIVLWSWTIFGFPGHPSQCLRPASCSLALFLGLWPQPLGLPPHSQDGWDHHCPLSLSLNYRTQIQF